MKNLHKITIIGVGLIGGSFALGLKKLGLIDEIVGYGHNADNLQLAVDLNVIDSFSTDIKTAVENSDLIMLSVPLGVMQTVLRDMQPFLKADAIITDAGSAKMSVVEAVQAVFGELPSTFVPGHPIAGKEQSGVAAACEDLFKAHRVILTPTVNTDAAALQTVQSLWQALGANVQTMTPAYHDEVLAATSHLPHLLAFALVDLLNEHDELGNVFQYTAGGFRDFTRIASSDATMWRDIALYNSDAISKWLKHYQNAIGHLIELVDAKDGPALHHLFSEAKAARDEHIVKK
ncbi:prephenate dehydrogenase [Thiomicrorhabdus aquaedulcis]|uniref:prephenate dehydrogenase n=1 Tax=Thiomicrorhabdus aquaedulcis TaxID=2211106 RepID=UPI000FD760D6|nr:prephenate dehydrogenase/arogenate dehydrogenase family protein [Thiomicrorhabdus aquaedulcis]